MKVLITGASGFIGQYLAQQAATAGHTVAGIDIKEPDSELFRGVFEYCDVRNAALTHGIIKSSRPDVIFHLAAQSFPTVSMTHPLETMETNAAGTINVFEGVRSAGIQPVVVVACSSAEYGTVAAEDLPVREEHQLRPLHPTVSARLHRICWRFSILRTTAFPPCGSGFSTPPDPGSKAMSVPISSREQ